MTKAELAAQIKAKYPAYAGVPDDELVAKIVAKYPVYATRLTDGGAAPAPAASPTPTPKPITEAADPANAEPDPAEKPGFIKGFLQTSPLNPRNIYSMAKGLYAPTAKAGMQVLQDVTQGNFPQAAIGALDLVRGGPAMRTVTDPILQHAVGTGQALEQGDLLKAAEQATGVIPFNAGMLQLGQENAGNPRALLGNLAGALTAPSQMKGAARVAGKGTALAGKATRAAVESAPGQKVASVLDKFNTTAKAAISKDAMDQAGATAVTTGAITMNPLVGLSAGAVELARRVIPEFIERWRNNGATLNEIKTATKVAEKEAANKLKYRGVSKGEFDQIQDHLKSLKVEAEAAAKAARAESAELKQTQRVEKVAEGREVQRQKKMSEMDQQAEAQTLKAQETESFKSGGAEAKTQDLFQKLRERAEKAKAPAADQPPTVTIPGETGPKVVSPAAPGPDLSPARKSATAIVYAENKATGKPYTLPEIEAGIKKSHPSLTPEQVSQVAKETVADAMHVETVVGGLASRGQSITQISQFIRRAYPDLPNSKLMELAVREVQAMGDAMTPAQRAELGIVRSASNKRKLDPTTLKPRS